MSPSTIGRMCGRGPGQYRCELTSGYLRWIDRDIEEEDLGYRV